MIDMDRLTSEHVERLVDACEKALNAYSCDRDCDNDEGCWPAIQAALAAPTPEARFWFGLCGVGSLLAFVAEAVEP